MLRRLVLKEFVIVASSEIAFDSGFSVLTGETGAGKSILLDAIGLLLGARADASAVREGAARADLSGEFGLTPTLAAWLAERELSGDEDSLLLRRIVEADGRSKALINGHPATAALLRELGESLIDIHGQHSAQSLLRADGQRELVDAVGGSQDTVRELAGRHRAWREATRQLEAALAGDRERELERERLEWRAQEIAALHLEADEWTRLNADHRRLSHAAALVEGAGQGAAALKEDDASTLTQIGQVLQRLRPLAQVDERLTPAIELLEGAEIQVEEAAAALAHYASRIDLDPAMLQQAEERISQVFNLARRLRVTPETLYDEGQSLQAQLAALSAAADVDALRLRSEAAEAAYRTLAGEVSRRRRETAARLGEGISTRLQALGMTGARLEVAVEAAAEPGPAGLDRIEFRIAGHAGATPRALAKVASGGELSRVGLAISVLAAEANPVPTLIFDEADAGVGGAVAEVIGGLMRELGQTRQVLCVTHLPQVAAQAHHQFRVSKLQRGSTTLSEVRPLGPDERIEEVARMLGGQDLTATTRQHAREMLDTAGRPGPKAVPGPAQAGKAPAGPARARGSRAGSRRTPAA